MNTVWKKCKHCHGLAICDCKECKYYTNNNHKKEEVKPCSKCRGEGGNLEIITVKVKASKK